MASFDMILAVGHAYQRTWLERSYLMRMALIPLLIKYICYTISLTYIGPDNIIRVSLVMLPAYFAEGWLLAHWARTIILGHRWPFRPSGDEKADLVQLHERGRGIVSGMVAFTLINLLMAGYFAFFMSYIPLDMDPKTADPKIAGIGIFMMVSSLLLFRFVWSYIPLAVNYPFQEFVKKMKSLGPTFPMIGLWLVCFVPPVMALQVLGGLLQSLAVEGDVAVIADALTMFVRVSLDMVKNVLCTAGMAYAFIEFFKWKNPE